MIRLLNLLGPAKHQKVAIYVVNQRIANVCTSRESCFAAEQFVGISWGQKPETTNFVDKPIFI